MWPILVMLPNALSLSLYVLQKTSFMGAQGQPDYTPIAADAVAGIVVGLATLSVIGFLVPWIATACGKSLRVRRLHTALIEISTCIPSPCLPCHDENTDCLQLILT